MRAVPALLALWASAAYADPPFEVAGRIPLGNVIGRLDHLAVDLKRDRLFVAELGNGSVSVIDVGTDRVLRRLSPFSEPQGVAFSTAADALAVASGGDGTVRVFRGESLAPGPVVNGLADADNLRIDAGTGRLVVGHSAGAVTALDWGQGRASSSIRIPGHPESFQLEGGGSRAFVNVPASAAVIVLDRQRGQVTARWALEGARSNYPMALDERHGWLWTVTREPARVFVLDVSNGRIVSQMPACGDADDVFVDPKREQAYIICGAGEVQVIGWSGGAFRELSRFPTASGARTGLFVPEWDALFVAAPARNAHPATIWRLVPGSDSTHDR